MTEETKEATGVVLGRLAPPLREGFVYTGYGFYPARTLEIKAAVSVGKDKYDWRKDPLYNAAQNNARRKRIR